MHRLKANLTAALLTPPGRGAVAVIRLHASSPEATGTLIAAVDNFFQAVNGKPLEDQNFGQLCYGHWKSANRSAEVTVPVTQSTLREDVVVCRTSPTGLEVSCHGGTAAVQRILAELGESGVATVDWTEQEALVRTPLEAEFAEALSRTRTAKTAARLLNHGAECLTQAVQAVLQELPGQGERPREEGLLGREERRRGEDPRRDKEPPPREPPPRERPPRERPPAEQDRIRKGLDHLDELLRWSEFGKHLTEPWRVVLAGRPNVGKSTLINALLGYSRAIVFDQPGTTRDVVTGETAFDGWPVQLSDTAGIRATGDQLERAGVDRTRQAVRQADLVCLLLDLSEPEDPEDPEERELLEELLDRDSDRVPPCLVIAHKSDLPAVRTPPEPVEPLPVSSVTGTGVDELIGRIVSTLVPEPPPEHRAVPVTGRQVRWLQRARDHLASDEVDKARTALQNCLEGTAFEGA